jgi:rsbT antagonist protein RsbS
MRVPILKQERFLVASVQSALSDKERQQLCEDLGDRVGEHRSRGVIIDISCLDILDSLAARTLRSIACVTALRGAKTVIAGIQPDVAYPTVRPGLSQEDIDKALDLEDGMAILGGAIEGGDGAE